MSLWKQRSTIGLLALGLFCGKVHAQEKPPAPTAEGSLEAINATYLKALTEVETNRLKQLDALSQRTTGEEQLNAYAALFQGALTSNQYQVVEPAAERLIKAGHPEPGLVYLASLVNLLAEIDRGAYDESLQSLAAGIRAGKAADPDGAPVSLMLSRDTRLMLAETYYQRLVQADQFEIARKAFALIAKETTDDAMRAYASDRLARLEMIGKPAPAIEGTDIDGKPFKLADLKGNSVLVVFWASWCVPSSAEADYLEQIFKSYRDKGFRIVGINVDGLQETGETPAQLQADVRRFLVDHHIDFSNLISGLGNPDFAQIYGVNDIPSSFLINAQGDIVHVDVTLANLEANIKKLIGK